MSGKVHGLKSVAVSVVFFATVVCALAANGDSLSGGPASVGSSEATTENESQATTQSSAEGDLKLTTPTIAPVKTATSKKSVGSGRSSAWLTREINSIAKPQRRVVRRVSKKHVAYVTKKRRAGKKWKVVSYDWRNGTKKTSYVKGSNLTR